MKVKIENHPKILPSPPLDRDARINLNSKIRKINRSVLTRRNNF